MRQPTKVDLDRPNRHQSKFNNEEILDVPLPSSVKPSTLEFSEAHERKVKYLKSPTYPVRYKDPVETATQKVDSCELDFKSTNSEFSLPLGSIKSKRYGESRYKKQTRHTSIDYDKTTSKYSRFSKDLEFESKQEQLPAGYPYYSEEDMETTKQEDILYENNPRVFSFAEGCNSMNDYTHKDTHSFYQGHTMSSTDEQSHTVKRKVNSFELNNFEKVKLTRQEEWPLFKRRGIPSVYEDKERSMNTINSLAKKQPHFTPRYREIEEKV